MDVTQSGGIADGMRARWAAATTQADELEEKEVGTAEEDGEEVEPAEPEAVESTTETEETEQGADASEKGVLRLLRAGHFKGVADVVLRINFHDELAEAEAAEVTAAVGEKAEALRETVESGVRELIDSGLLDEEQSATATELGETFEQKADALAEEYAGTGDLAAFVDGLRAAFDGLTGALQDLLLPDAPEPESAAEVDGEAAGEETATSEVVTADSGATSTSEAEESEAGTPAGLLSELEENFNSALEELEATPESVSVLPPLSPPEGNGVAYSKFLAIYTEMQSLGGVEEGEEETTTDSAS